MTVTSTCNAMPGKAALHNGRGVSTALSIMYNTEFTDTALSIYHFQWVLLFLKLLKINFNWHKSDFNENKLCKSTIVPGVHMDSAGIMCSEKHERQSMLCVFHTHNTHTHTHTHTHTSLTTGSRSHHYPLPSSSWYYPTSIYTKYSIHCTWLYVLCYHDNSHEYIKTTLQQLDTEFLQNQPV